MNDIILVKRPGPACALYDSSNRLAGFYCLGDPPTSYVNASVIKFPGTGQIFIASQAPRDNSFSNFWQMILEKKVSTIVMITGPVFFVAKISTKASKFLIME